MKIVVTGANGFIGKNILIQLSKNPNYKLYAITRKKIKSIPANVIQILVQSLENFKEYEASLKNADVIIHSAGAAHKRFNDKEIYDFNYHTSVSLFNRCETLRIKKFIFLSSISVISRSQGKLTEESAYSPHNMYSLSKVDFEKYLISNANETNFTIIRPPMVYGDNAPGTFASLKNALLKNIPLPLSGFTANKRDFISIENLVDFIEKCLLNNGSTNQIFNVSDDCPMSTFEFADNLKRKLNSKSLFFNVPKVLIEFLLKALNKTDVFESLNNNLEIDIKKAKTTLRWNPKKSTLN